MPPPLLGILCWGWDSHCRNHKALTFIGVSISPLQGKAGRRLQAGSPTVSHSRTPFLSGGRLWASAPPTRCAVPPGQCGHTMTCYPALGLSVSAAEETGRNLGALLPTPSSPEGHCPDPRTPFWVWAWGIPRSNLRDVTRQPSPGTKGQRRGARDGYVQLGGSLGTKWHKYLFPG